MVQANHSLAWIPWLAAILAASCRGEVVDGLIQVPLNDNGGWCWFEDDRAVISNGQLYVGSVSDSSGTGGRNGNVEVAAYHFDTGILSRFVLHAGLQADDHNSPALHVRPDGRLVAMYATHGSDSYTRWRISTNPGDATSWEEEQTFDNGASTTYSNVYRLAAENGGAGQTYNFTRSIGWDPNFLISSNDGATWSYGGRLLDAPGRPYVRYTANHLDQIHFITTEQHPRDFDNSIYHGYIQNGSVYQSDGTYVSDLDSTGDLPTDFTRVFAGDANNVAWTTDIELDGEGNPYIAFSVQKNQNDQDHRYYYGRWDGTGWNVHEMAYAGSCLYDPENDYTGLVALNPDDPDTVYISADVDPSTGSPLISSADSRRHYEIFQGATTDGGATWAWEPITANSTVDNIRPIMPVSDGEHTALLWLAGTYSSYTNYDLDVVGIITPDPPIRGDLNHDGLVNGQDYVSFLGGLHSDLSGCTLAEAYQMGDMNADLANNYADFLLFRDAYDAANGAGAFDIVLASVPESSAFGLICISMNALLLNYLVIKRDQMKVVVCSANDTS